MTTIDTQENGIIPLSTAEEASISGGEGILLGILIALGVSYAYEEMGGAAGINHAISAFTTNAMSYQSANPSAGWAASPAYIPLM